MSSVAGGGQRRTYRAFPGWLCITGSRVRRYIRNSYGKIVLTDEAVMEVGTVEPAELEVFRDRPER